MIRIYFTQCDPGIKEDELSREASFMPILRRVEFYESILTDTGTAEYTTLDENFLLVAQWMRQEGRIAELEFVSLCGCPMRSVSRTVIPIDAEGDLTECCHHGFFNQRLKYLR